ncbi:MAG TPA: hypothetical protein VEF06_01940 [Bryobacteraceae bacterium]|nr:hypothetical protein [Bryobacteraceae bacterium]
MFFRHEKARQQTFEEHMSAARSAGFRTESAGPGRTRIERGNVACVATSEAGGMPVFVERAGIVMGKEIGSLTDGGFQKFFSTPGGQRKPALAEELKAVQDFQEDLREALGLTALYNESLGTTSNVYVYDRVVGRDHGDAHKPWE